MTHTCDEVLMTRDNAVENRAEHPSSSGSDSRRRITTKREPREVRDAQTRVTEPQVPRRISKKATLSEHPVAVTTQEALDGYREKTIRIASVESNTLNRVSISSAGALDMTHRDFSVRSARDEMRRIIGSSEPDVIIGSDMDQKRDARRRTRIAWNSCASCMKRGWRAVATFVHEETTEEKSRMKCITRIMAMPGTRTIVTDLCMFGLGACDEGPNARQVGMRMQSKCTGAHRHARVGANNISEKMEQTGTWVHRVARVMEERLRLDQEELKTREQKNKAKDANRIRGIVHESDKKT